MILSDAAKTGGANGTDAVTFFDSTVVAKRIAFVVDASTSMDGGRFDRAKEELLTAVSNLNPRQRFYVYFFSDKDYPMLAPRLADRHAAARHEELGLGAAVGQ